MSEKGPPENREIKELEHRSKRVASAMSHASFDEMRLDKENDNDLLLLEAMQKRQPEEPDAPELAVTEEMQVCHFIVDDVKH